MKRMLLILTMTLSVLMVGAQQKKQLTLEDVISGGKNFRKFIPENKYMGFLGDTDMVFQNEGDSLYVIGENNSKDLLLSLTEVNEALKGEDLKALKSLYRITFIGETSFWVNNGESIIVYGIQDKKVAYYISYPKGAKDIDYNIEANAIAYIYNKDLYIATPDSEPVLVEKAGAEHIVLGQSVHRNEFGIHNGMFWSPKGKSLAFYRMDESMVTDYPLVDITARVAELENIKYPMAGMKSHHVTVGVYDINKKELKYLKTGEPKEKYLTNVSWSPDEKYILIAELNRGQNHMRLNQYDTQSGILIKELFEEKSTRWVEPENPALFIPGKGNQFIWQSERDGFNHLYWYDIEKGLVKQLTKGDWVVTKVHGFDAKNKSLFFESTKDGAMDRHLYKVQLSSGRISKITNAEGYHTVNISNSGNRVIDNYSSLNVPRVIQVIDVRKRKENLLFTAANPFEGMEVGKVTLNTLKAADGKTDLKSRIILPPNFDPNKKYPVVVYVYGGPHAQLVRNSWLGSARLWQLYMAQQGYIAYTMDNRGTPYRGCEFEKIIHRRLGEIEAADQYEGIKYLQSLPYVDADRIGVHGWSFGGFMTINLMEKYPETFKVGVSGGPVTDWKYYEIMYGERYMDTPEENPEGYKRSNVNERVDQLKGRLLVIHGAIDPVVVWQHSMDFIEQTIKKRKQVDYFVYPRHEHNVLGPDRVHLMEKVTLYFTDFL
ncbi:S9 family peptidase [Labilibacter sediminis]|nr:S9 family peptidase [Labilibacter sediminis]